MGIDNNFLYFLAESTKSGVDLAKTATLGRQNFYRITEASLVAGLRRAGFSATPAEARAMLETHGVYADALLRFLGADVLDTFDYSDYEGATCIVDMNKPIDPVYHGRYTTVLDGGSLEHIFNFPQAITNCMQMVAEGGHFVAFCPANNFFGHGFYQFSAELFFRIFSPENGFVATRIVLVEDDQSRRGWFEVADPASVRERVTLMSATPCHLFVRSRKVRTAEPFAAPPYQSDYVTMWQTSAEPLHSAGRRPSPAAVIRDMLKGCLPHEAKEWIRRRLFPGPRVRTDHFRPITK
jgi:hypothetical protein